MSTKFLDVSDVIAIHQEILEYGGASGIRSMELLQSAVAMPSSGFGDEYFHQSIYEMAAAYLYHIVNNHPFVDGNKRVGLMAAYVFLEINNIELNAPEDEFEQLVLATASGKVKKAEIAHFFKTYTSSKV